MSDDLAAIIAQVRAWDDARERSQQKEVGWSQVAGCRRAIGYSMAGEWVTDDPDTWRAEAGTALHLWLQDVRRGEALKHQWHMRFEVGTSYAGIPGHADEVIYEAGRLIVTDYKFPSLRSAGVWTDPAVLDEKFIQVQGYAAGLFETAADILSDILSDDQVTVRMLVVPVDGTFDDWQLFERPFSRRVADAAADRVIHVETMLGQGQELPRDKPLWWCSKFCQFFTACRGDYDEPDLPEIEDAEMAAAVEAYGLAKEQSLEAEKIIEAIGPMIRGLRGTARGWRVTTGKAQMDMRPDMDQIRSDYEASGLVVPERSTPKSAALRVTRIKS